MIRDMRSQFARALFLFLTGLGAQGLSFSVSAQIDIENVIVETYYVSDANDATDTDGGALAAGSVTYRVFLDLLPGVRLRGFFGSVNHPFVISSTEVFFNNEDRGEPYGFDIPEIRIDENTVAVDSWLSLGRATGVHWAVEKSTDSDGSLVGGVNSDGGSEGVPGGILINEDMSAGLPLILADGLIPYTGSGLINFIATGDPLSTVFGEISASNEFNSTSFNLINVGVLGQTEDNRILIGQFTTTGALSFSLNVRLIRNDGTLINYVADGAVLGPDESVSSLLTYPPQCGCTDPDFLEYDEAAGCEDGSCATLVILGCNDPAACNYDPEVNFNVPELCCILPDNCIGLDSDLLCPGAVGISDAVYSGKWNVFPNPSREYTHLSWSGLSPRICNVELRALSGELIWRKEQVSISRENQLSTDTSLLSPGMYILLVSSGDELIRFPIVRVP